MCVIVTLTTVRESGIMWEQYKKTFIGIQIVIAMVTVGVQWRFDAPAMTALFFCVMQIGSVVGAWWAARLKAKFSRREHRLPLKPVQ
jgi:hypothetical protein